MLAYTIAARNTGTGTATGVVLTDELPLCLDDAGFDPLVDVAVSPGPAGGVDYNRTARRLTLLLPDMPAGAVETVTVSGLRAGDPECCNQASLVSRELTDRHRARLLAERG